MTPEEFKARFTPRVIDSYLREPNKVLVTAAFQSMNSHERNALQGMFESGNATKAGRMLQDARRRLAAGFAESRLDEIIADGNISLDLEIDELI